MTCSIISNLYHETKNERITRHQCYLQAVSVCLSVVHVHVSNRLSKPKLSLSYTETMHATLDILVDKILVLCVYTGMRN